MAIEVTFNPDTGSGEFVGGNVPNEQQEQISAQELSDAAQARSFRHTAEHLSQRAAEKQGAEVSQTGSGNVELEIKLQETQRELYQLQNGSLPNNPLRMLQLEALQDRLASELVGGVAPSPDQETEEVWDPKADLEEGLANDPAVQNTLLWSSETFSQETNESFNEMLANSNDAVTTQNMVQTLKDLRANPDSFSTVDASEMHELSQQTIDWFSAEYSPSIANEVATISAAVRNGVASKRDALALVIKSPDLLKACLSAAHNPSINFTLGL